MKKRLVFTLSIIILSIFMVSCNDITKEVAKGEQLRHDISEIESLKHCHRDEFVYDSEFELVDYSIIKRQTNAELKQDIVYCDVEMENQYFKVFLETKLTYNYYDVGGWILDDCTYQKKNIIPIAPAETGLVLNNISSVYYVYEGEKYVHGLPYESGEFSFTWGDVSFDSDIYETTLTYYLNHNGVDIECCNILEFSGENWEFKDFGFILRDGNTHELYSNIFGKDDCVIIKSIMSYSSSFGNAIGNHKLNSKSEVYGMSLSVDSLDVAGRRIVVDGRELYFDPLSGYAYHFDENKEHNGWGRVGFNYVCAYNSKYGTWKTKH